MIKITRRLNLLLLSLLLGLTLSPSEGIQCDLLERGLLCNLRHIYDDPVGEIEIRKRELSTELQEMDFQQRRNQLTALARSQEINALLDQENERLKSENAVLQEAARQVREENLRQFSRNTELLEVNHDLRIENTRLAYYWSEKVSGLVVSLCGCLK